MSFLNPVNEPVLRFKSTDAGAPQIDYNTRIPGDIKAVLKACLVTGYGAKASAGWSVVNEVAHVAEFVSAAPSVSDYRFGIDDTAAGSTTWYYQYQNTRVNPAQNTVNAPNERVVKTSAKNGWQLIVTTRGFCFIEILESSAVYLPVVRVTWFGQIKSALITSDDKNIAFWSTGLGAPYMYPAQFFDNSSGSAYYDLGGVASVKKFAATNLSCLSYVAATPSSVLELINPLYITASQEIIGEYPGLLIKSVNGSDDFYNVKDVTFNGRPVLYACAAGATTESVMRRYAAAMMFYLDYWEY